MVRISIVSYLNSRPFVYGLKNFSFSEDVEISEDIPSVCADKLIDGRADIGLVPVAALPLIPNSQIISDYCIGANGEVRSVLLLSDVPIEKIKTVLLDYQSRTSIMLTRILFKEHWKFSPEFISAKVGYEKDITGSTAGVVIGDRAMEMRSGFKYVYDLSAEWEKMTSLPFVFACWVSSKNLSDKFIGEFNSALSNGLNKIDVIAEKEKSSHLTVVEIKNYLNECIDYSLDGKKREAMELFLGFLKRNESVY